MTPDQLATLKLVAETLQKVGTWPLGLVLLVIEFGPWALIFVAFYWQDKRFSKVVEMYENNVNLVVSFEEIAKSFKDVVIFNTQVMTQVKDIADNNLFCPLNRRQIKPRDININKEE